MTWRIFGHENIKFILEKQLQKRAFPHAYLFSGPGNVGKRSLAEEYAQKILGAENLRAHPDFLPLDTSGEITMETVLEFIERLALKPFAAEYKVAVLNNAENLNPQSGNALLKILEEPPEKTVIILVANSGKVLPTLASRCQIFNFFAFGRPQLEEFCRREKIREEKELLELAFGRPGRLKRLAEDGEYLSAQKEALAEWQKISAVGRGEKLALIGSLAETDDAELSGKFLTWLLWEYGNLKSTPENYKKLGALSDAILGLKKNFNKKLVLQNLFLNI